MIVSQRLIGVERHNGMLVGHFYNEFDRSTTHREASQIVVEHGTLPNDELYFNLKGNSLNQGIINFDALVNGTPQNSVVNPDGTYELFRVGDAVASRNIHAALYDSLRLCLQI